MSNPPGKRRVSVTSHPPAKRRVCVIGAGIAGCITALGLAQAGASVTVIEKGSSIISGPPFCHLHAGGAFYREIDLTQRAELLRQSIESIRAFPGCFNRRPTVIATPKSDGSDPNSYLEQMVTLRNLYTQLIKDDPENKVLGEPEKYFSAFSKCDMRHFSKQVQPEIQPDKLSHEEWVIPFAREVELDDLVYPVIVVNEWGWSMMRQAAVCQGMMNANLNINLQLLTSVNGMKIVSPVSAKLTDDGPPFQVETLRHDGSKVLEQFDFVVNAAGWKSGKIDEMLAIRSEGLVELKSAYLVRWCPLQNEQWPEMLFHGPRNTDQGMSQLTPYTDGIMQIHGMTPDITLFRGGLVESSSDSTQPMFPDHLNRILHEGWDEVELEQRTKRAIAHGARFLPALLSAKSVSGDPLYGGQQIPGSDPDLRVGAVSFPHDSYARIEIVKASSAVNVAREICRKFLSYKLTPSDFYHLSTMTGLSEQEIHEAAETEVSRRGLPTGLIGYFSKKELHHNKT